MLEPVTAQFIQSAAALPPDALAGLVDESLRRWPAGGRVASKASNVLTASESSVVSHAVRSALRPRADELNDYRQYLFSDAVSTTVIAARAMLKRNRIAQEHYLVLVEPFAQAGVAVPA